MAIRLSQKWFNPLYFHLNKYIDDPNVRKIMVYGGKSSSKTFSIAQLLLIKAYTRNASAICYRKEQTTIKTTLKPTFVKALESCYLEQAHTVMDFRITCSSGSQIVFKGMDEATKVKGVEGFKYLLFDELDHFTQEDWKQANLSLRGMPDQKLFATWNPVDENIWIKQELNEIEWNEMPLTVDGNPYSQLDKNSFVRLSKDGKTLLIKTTYFDNKWMIGGGDWGYRDENLIYEYEQLKFKDENSYNVNVLGEWGITNKEGKFCWAFVPEQVKPTTRDPERILWATFDFNINPMSCTIAQIIPEETTVRAIECIKLPNSDTWQMCDRLIASYPDAIWMVTGDATGRNGSAMVADNMNHYLIIQNKLNLTNQQLAVPKSNPPIKENRLLVNAVHKNWTIEIDPEHCKPLIYDLKYVEVDDVGKIIKGENRGGSETDNNLKKFADFLDGWRYLINNGVREHFAWNQ